MAKNDSNVDLTGIGIEAAPAPIKRQYTRKRDANIFDAPLQRSYDTAWTDADGKEHEHGQPQQTAPMNAAQLEAAHKALTSAGRYLGLGVKRQEISQDADGKGFGFGRKALRFQGVPLRQRKTRKNGGDATSDGQVAAVDTQESEAVSA